MVSSPTRPSSPDILTGRPKHHTRGPPTPPPAYVPRGHSGPIFMNPYLAARLAQQAAFAASSPAVQRLPRPRIQPHPTAHVWHDIDDLSSDAEDDDDGDGDGDGDGDRSSAITVRIATAVRVAGDHNLVCLPGGAAHPAETARFVAQAVTRVLRGGGAEARGGIPMIDEEGRPRPLRIEIEAGTEVRGEGNVLGGERVVMKALGKRRRDERESRENEDEEEEDVQVLRRRRRGRCSSV